MYKNIFLLHRALYSNAERGRSNVLKQEINSHNKKLVFHEILNGKFELKKILPYFIVNRKIRRQS